jgi:hypothetical protein
VQCGRLVTCRIFQSETAIIALGYNDLRGDVDDKVDYNDDDDDNDEVQHFHLHV